MSHIKQISYESIFRRKFTLPSEIKHSHKLSDALNCINQRWPNDIDLSNDTEHPVFLFSAGWRSGSTLMQRLLISSNEIFIWGEPLGDAALIPKLGSVVSSVNSNWPPDNYFDEDPDLDSVSKKWIANLTPPISYLKSSHRLILQKWLGEPCKERYGLDRWGLKEVRLTIDHAKYLKWLFPNSRFIFIYRNPFDAYSSWKGNLWGDSWPGYFSRSVVAFMRHWRILLDGFIEGYKEVDGLLIKFEDLVSNKINLELVADHIKVNNINASVLNKKIRSPNKIKEKVKKKILPHERYFISFIGMPLLKKLGYTQPK
jgi:hypothetical protein